MRKLIFVCLLLLIPAIAHSQPGMGTGEITGVRLYENNAFFGDCENLDFIDGFKLSRTGSSCSVLNAAGVVNAKKYLNCDGVTPDSAALKALVEVGGACAGKTCVFDSRCSMLLSTPNTSAGGGYVVKVPPNTKLIADKGALPTIKLAGRSCVGGNTPGAACPNGSSDCNGGSCNYDDTTNSKQFAWNAADTYTIFKGPANADCTGNATPWACCRESGNGLCDQQSQGIEITGFTIDARQIEDWGRCNNGAAEQGWACKSYCSWGATLTKMACSENSDCVTGTCTNAAQCPSVNSSCTNTPLSVIGSGSVVVADFAGAAGTSFRNVAINNLNKGQGILGAMFTEVNNVDISVTGDFALLPVANAFYPTLWYPLALTNSVSTGISVGRASKIRNSHVNVNGTGIAVANSTLGVYQWRNDITQIDNNYINITNSTSGVAISTAAPYSFITNNRIDADGSANTAISLTGAADYSHVGDNSISLTGTTSAGGVISLADYASFSGNTIRSTVPSTSAYRSGSAGGGTAIQANFAGNSYTLTAASSTGIELYGFYSSWVGGNGSLPTAGGATGGQHFVTGGDAQKVVSDNVFVGGSICGGMNAAGSGTGINVVFANNRCYIQSVAAVYPVTGWELSNNYFAWMENGANGIVIGDDRAGLALGNTHTLIVGNLVFTNFANNVLVRYANVSGGQLNNLTITGNNFISPQNGVVAIDLSNFDTNSPTISNSIVDGNVFGLSGASTIAMKFSTLFTSKYTGKFDIGSNVSNATTYVQNWLESIGNRPFQLLTSGTGTLATNAATYQPVTGFSSAAITSATGVFAALPAGDLGAFRCDLDVAPSASNTRVLNLQVDGVTQRTCTITGAATTCTASNLVPYAITAYQKVRFEQLRTGATASGLSCSLKFYPNL